MPLLYRYSIIKVTILSFERVAILGLYSPKVAIWEKIYYIHTKPVSYPPIEFSPRIQEKKLGIRKIFLHGFVFSIHGFEFPLTGLFFPFTGLSFHSRV